MAGPYRRKSSVKFGGREGQDIFARKLFWKKINKTPEFYMIIARKIFLREFWGYVSPCPHPSLTPGPVGRCRVVKFPFDKLIRR